MFHYGINRCIMGKMDISWVNVSIMKQNVQLDILWTKIDTLEKNLSLWIYHRENGYILKKKKDLLYGKMDILWT